MTRLEAALAELAEAIREELRAEGQPAPERLLPVGAVAERLAIGRSKVYHLIANGSLRSLTIGDRRLIPQSAVTEYIAGQEQAATVRDVRRGGRMETTDAARQPRPAA